MRLISPAPVTNIYIKKKSYLLEVVAHNFIPTTLEEEAGGLHTYKPIWSTYIHTNQGYIVRTCIKKTLWRVGRTTMSYPIKCLPFGKPTTALCPTFLGNEADAHQCHWAQDVIVTAENIQDYLHTSLYMYMVATSNSHCRALAPRLVAQGNVWVLFSRRHSSRAAESRDRTKQTQRVGPAMYWPLPLPKSLLSYRELGR